MKYARRHIAFELYDFEGIESWLTDLSAKGLQLVSMSMRFAKFEKTEPREYRYRLEVTGENKLEPDDGLRELYEDFGWEFVDTYGEAYYVFRTADKNAPEPHTDPEILAITLKKTVRRSLWGYAAMALILMIGAAVVLGISFTGDTPLLKLVSSGGTLKLLMGCILMVIACIWVVNDLRGILHLQRKIRDGAELNHRKSYRWTSLFVRLSLIVLIFCDMIWILVSFTAVGRSVKYELSDYEGELPFVRLEEIENREDLTVGGFEYRDFDYGNFMCERRDALTRSGIELSQYGHTPVESDSPSLQIEYYEFKFEKLAARAAEEFGADIIAEYEELNVPGADRARLYKVEDVQILVLRAGDRVEKIHYTGTRELEDFAGMFAQRLAGV